MSAKKQDSVQQFRALRASLLSERVAMQKRLQQIDAALGEDDGVTTAPAVASVAKKRGRPPGSRTKVKASAPAPKSGSAKGGKRPQNALTMQQAIAQVTAQQPLGVSDVVAAMKQIGYTFQSAKPANSVGAYLYSAGKKHFKRVDGKFSPISSSVPAPAPVKESTKPARQKNRMSEAGRKAIAAAQKARWAKPNATKAKK